MIKLGSQVTETATGLPGMVTQMQVEMNQQRYYLFQPRGLNPEDGTPVKRFWCVETRISGGEIIPDVKMPVEVLGTEVEDTASGFAGVATAICLHISGCVHVTVQPKGKLAKTNAAVEAHDFDIRRLKGDAIKPMTETERQADQTAKPSPENITRYQPRMSE
jgi:hypothetical protein